MASQNKPFAPILPGIEHVVVLMFENRSFDNVLGGLYPDKSPTEYDGLTGDETNPVYPACPHNTEQIKVWQGPTAPATTIMPYPDPGELFNDMNEQLFGGCPETEPANMKGFVSNYLRQDSSPDGCAPDAKQIMQYFAPGPGGNIPVTSALAQAYAVSDRWFASGPVQTLANRIFVHCAMPGKYQDDNGDWHAVINNTDITSHDLEALGFVTQPPIFEQLDEAGQSWKVYYHDWPLSTFVRYVLDRWCLVEGHVRPFKCHLLEDRFFPDFFYDVQHGLPAYSFIEPAYTDLLGGIPNSNHPGGSTIKEEPPPISICNGENLLNSVYTALYNGPNNLFEKTLLIVTYDEHGGLYDHVPPGGAVSPFLTNENIQGFAYARYGVRVPAIFINPYIQPGTVFRPPAGSPPFDHTSIISTLRAQFPNVAGPLTPRDQAAPTLAGLIDTGKPLNKLDPAILSTLECQPVQKPCAGRTAGVKGPKPHSIAAVIKQAAESHPDKLVVARAHRGLI